MVRPLILPLCVLLAGCAASPQRFERVALTDQTRHDPWENTNRRIYALSNKVDRAVIMPVVDTYRFIVPAAARRGVSNMFDNLGEPTNLANAMAQGKVKRGFRAMDRILVNGVLGLGIADHATEMGLETQDHDFGQTMAVWGVPSGPFVMMPFLGPSTLRDGLGFGVDFLLDPTDFGKNRILDMKWRAVQLGFRVINIRIDIAEQGEQLLIGSADPYATIRSAWLQNRHYELWDGNPPAMDDEDDWDADDWDADAAPQPASESVSAAPGTEKLP